jgi:cell division inhibitor SepF
MAKEKNAQERIDFILMNDDLDVLKIADKLLYGTPIMVNFENYNEIESNKIITFLSGVTYAIDGEIEQVTDQVFLFASKQDYKDGSLRKFVKQFK